MSNFFEGTTNIPQVTEVKDFRRHLRKARESIDSVPPLIRRLVKDGYICFYSNPDVTQYHEYQASTSLYDTNNFGTSSV